ncbi:unnamed protein product [Polarella glacialis]|uniref:Uncharacterized protein n=1 Tax=Polarella glacialis TaxID=89957 RepID=A0A813DER1_POLGL|nr:unnamed protein product [Polarella glacialis]
MPELFSGGEEQISFGVACSLPCWSVPPSVPLLELCKITDGANAAAVRSEWMSAACYSASHGRQQQHPAGKLFVGKAASIKQPFSGACTAPLRPTKAQNENEFAQCSDTASKSLR